MALTNWLSSSILSAASREAQAVPASHRAAPATAFSTGTGGTSGHLAVHRHQGVLGIGAFEQLAGGALTIGELAGRCGANPEILRRVLRCVAATGLLRSAGPQRYELTDACRAVMDGWAFAGFRFNADPEIWNALGELTETIRTGKAPLIDRYGGLYGYLATRPATAAGFDALVREITPRPPARWRRRSTSPSWAPWSMSAAGMAGSSPPSCRHTPACAAS